MQIKASIYAKAYKSCTSLSPSCTNTQNCWLFAPYPHPPKNKITRYKNLTSCIGAVYLVFRPTTKLAVFL